MPKADFTNDYRSDHGQSRFPRLKLQAFEKARIVVVGAPQQEFVHRLEAPNIVNMAPVYKKINGRDGSEQVVVDTRFVSGPLCQGNFDVLRERGVDDKTCPACSAARDRPDIFRSPQPKWAVNILRYGLRPGGGWGDIANPYGVSALIWVFGAKVMDKLIDVRTMGEAYQDIRMVDLLLECDKDAVFQKPYSNGEFTPIAPAVWTANEATRKYTLDYLAANGASEEDLTASIGKKVKADWMADDLSRVIQRWDVVRAHESRVGGAPQVGGQGFGAESLQQGMGQVQQQYGGGYAQQAGSGGNGQVGWSGNGQPANGYGGQGGSGAPVGGVDMSLMGGNFQPPAPPPPPAPAPDYMQAAQQAAANGQNPVVAAYETATGQPMPPAVPPTIPASGTVPPPAPQPSAPPAAAASPSSPPQGLSGLNEFMGSQPPVSHDELAAPPPPAPASALPAGGSWSFDDLKKAAEGK